MIWTAAGLYAVWRLGVRPLLRALYLVLRAVALLILAGLQLVAGVRLSVIQTEPTTRPGYRLADHPLDPDDIGRAEGYRHPPKKG